MLAKGVSSYKNLSIAQMYNNLANCKLSKNGKGHLNKKSFYWIFDAQPTPLSKSYKILIIYHKDNFSPWVYILSKDKSKLSKAPHLYDREKIRLCLYYPDRTEWNRTSSLCKTIVAWTYLWLYYYEEWLYSGEWKGGGRHPDNTLKSNNKKMSPLQKIRGKYKRKKVSNKNALNYINRIYKKFI